MKEITEGKPHEGIAWNKSKDWTILMWVADREDSENVMC